jgi:flagellar hook protein FlgE
MMRSLYAGVSGLQNHQVRMDVLGNNISNINTTGFKKGRVTFQDLLSQTMSGAARPTDEVGGVNPKQVGLGMLIAAIDTIHTQGSLQTTGVMTDLSIQGNGFFILKAGEREFFTRAGAFSLDENGYIVNPANGLKVQGWIAETIGNITTINTAADLEDLIIPVGEKDPARATTAVDFFSNLDKRTPVITAGAAPGSLEVQEGTWITTHDIFDSFGRAHKVQIEFTRDPLVANRWRASVAVDPDAEIPTNTDAAGGLAAEVNVFYVNFDNNGTLQSVMDSDLNVLSGEGNLQIAVAFDVPEADLVAGAAYRQTFNLNLGTVGSLRDSITQFASRSSAKMVKQDGYTMGYLESFKIDQRGVITGVYSNGANRDIGQVALASFTNPGGLEKEGENTYVVSNNSGEANIGESGIAGKGKIIAGALEMSNVDLAEQFTDMIVTQRGFQANSRSITTSDQMLQELLTLKR